jgi:UDP-N-acetylmuramoyl-L-alanyl-D-glutamate--2,6-diaminopimelate ligase
LKIYVDFAHTSDALTNVLESLQEFKQGRLINLFGCGGDRDPYKRPLMAQACERFSDFVIVTSDNPRSEDPQEIANQIVQGFSKNYTDYSVELDRRKAIEKAIDMAQPNDVILIAGKGHENHQIFAHKTIEFDDRKVASVLCEQKVHSTLQPLSTQ